MAIPVEPKTKTTLNTQQRNNSLVYLSNVLLLISSSRLAPLGPGALGFGKAGLQIAELRLELFEPDVETSSATFGSNKISPLSVFSFVVCCLCYRCFWLLTTTVKREILVELTVLKSLH
jgi:hypothetical protein